MLINLSDVLSEQHKTIDETVNVEISTYEGHDGKFPILSKEPVHVVVEHVKGQELLIKADTRMTVSIPCDRCLTKVKQELVLNVVKRVDLSVPDADLTEELDESNFIDGYNLDVDRLLYNEILTEWPTKVLCTGECRGICSVCGQNLNEGVCDCEDTGLDPRMSVIRDLFKEV